jgi:hypothetical protein
MRKPKGKDRSHRGSIATYDKLAHSVEIAGGHQRYERYISMSQLCAHHNLCNTCASCCCVSCTPHRGIRPSPRRHRIYMSCTSHRSHCPYLDLHNKSRPMSSRSGGGSVNLSFLLSSTGILYGKVVLLDNGSGDSIVALLCVVRIGWLQCDGVFILSQKPV